MLSVPSATLFLNLDASVMAALTSSVCITNALPTIVMGHGLTKSWLVNFIDDGSPVSAP